MIKPLLITGFLFLSGTSMTVDATSELPVTEEHVSEDIVLEELPSEENVTGIDPNLFIEPVIEFTKDSVYTKITGIELVPVKVTDPINYLVDVEIIVDIPHGYEIYDDESTNYIDGLQINGEWVSEYYIRDYDYKKPYTITVKTIYSDDIIGTLASMKDGNYDYMQLLSNPIALLMAVYYIISILSIIVGGFSAIRFKKIKVKSADEIANAVSTKAEDLKNGVKEYQEQFTQKAAETVQNIIEPVLVEIKKEMQTIIKAMVISNSKAKDAPLALLDTLETVATAKVTDLIAEVKSNISSKLATEESNKKATLEALNKISQPAQEVTANGKEEQETKSIF